MPLSTSRPLPSAWNERSSAPEGKAAAHVAAHGGEENNALATLARTGLVGGNRSCDRDLQPYISLVSHRIAGRAHPLGTDPGPARALRSTSPAGYRSSAEPTHDRELVRAALAGGGHLSASTTKARGGNPTAVDSTSDCPDHAVFVSSIFFGPLARRSARSPRHPAAAARSLLHQAAAHVS